MVIDTNIFIEHLRAKDKSKTELYNISDSATLFTSTVTIFELYMGTENPGKNSELNLVLAPIKLLNFTEIVAIEASKIFRELKQKNKLIEFRDIFIAATCIVHNQPLLTKNLKHFERIENLQLCKI